MNESPPVSDWAGARGEKWRAQRDEHASTGPQGVEVAKIQFDFPSLTRDSYLLPGRFAPSSQA